MFSILDSIAAISSNFDKIFKSTDRTFFFQIQSFHGLKFSVIFIFGGGLK